MSSNIQRATQFAKKTHEVWSRANIITIAGCAGVGGILTGVMGLLYYRHIQKRLLELSFHHEAIMTVKNNKLALELIGVPFRWDKPDAGDYENNFAGAYKAKLLIPIIGKKNNGHLHAYAERARPQDVWILTKTEFTLDKASTTSNRIFLFYKKKDSPTAARTPKPAEPPKPEVTAAWLE